MTRRLMLMMNPFFAPDLEDVSSSEFARQNLLAPVLPKLLSKRERAAYAECWIVGAVKAPGQYPILSSYEVGDLIKAAGGLESPPILPAQNYAD